MKIIFSLAYPIVLQLESFTFRFFTRMIRYVSFGKTGYDMWQANRTYFLIGKIHPENMIIELYSSGELVAINGTIMVIYEIVEWRLKWLSRGGTLLNIAERERGSSLALISKENSGSQIVTKEKWKLQTYGSPRTFRFMLRCLLLETQLRSMANNVISKISIPIISSFVSIYW